MNIILKQYAYGSVESTINGMILKYKNMFFICGHLRRQVQSKSVYTINNPHKFHNAVSSKSLSENYQKKFRTFGNRLAPFSSFA